MKISYSISEVCGLIGVGRSTLYSAIKKGDLKTFKIGRRTLLSSQAIDSWISGLSNNLEASRPTAKGGNHET